MAGQYAPLSNSADDHSLSARGPKHGAFFSRLSRLPRKWLILAFTIVACIAGLVTVHTQTSVNRGQSLPANLPVGTIPLLGGGEDPGKLWYPAPGRAPKFQPHLPAHAFQIDHYRRPRTPLFVGFTRNNDMLIQAVLSYLAAGWPASDIIVVDNSGTMDANPQKLLTSANPFYLDYATLRNRYGVSVLQTPTLLSFAQLQNFYLRTSIAHGWPFYFYSHMDIAVLSDETATPYESFYSKILGILADHGINGPDPTTYKIRRDWAVRFFTYDWLTLINTESWRTVGAWDVFIPYYATDCDAFARVSMNKFQISDVRAGAMYDLASIMPNPEKMFFPKSVDEPLNSERYQTLRQKLDDMTAAKNNGERNEWQTGKGDGGKGQAWTYHPQAFQKLWWDSAECGRQAFKKKWGTSECGLEGQQLTLKDMFKEMLAPPPPPPKSAPP